MLKTTKKIRVISGDDPGIDEDTKEEITPNEGCWYMPNGLYYMLMQRLTNGRWHIIRKLRVE